MANKRSPLIGILSFRTKEAQGKIVLEASCVLKMQGSSKPMDTGLIRIDVPGMQNAAEIKFRERYGKKLPKGFRLNRFVLTVDRGIANELDIQNKLIVTYDEGPQQEQRGLCA